MWPIASARTSGASCRDHNSAVTSDGACSESPSGSTREPSTAPPGPPAARPKPASARTAGARRQQHDAGGAAGRAGRLGEAESGDKLGSFWQSTAVAAEGKHGHVPAGITREAYSWGGMVRTTPQFDGSGAGGEIAAVGARVFYALILPFSIGNAVQWARRIARPGDSTGAQGLDRDHGGDRAGLRPHPHAAVHDDRSRRSRSTSARCSARADADRCEPLCSGSSSRWRVEPGSAGRTAGAVPVAASASSGRSARCRGCATTCCPGMEDNAARAGSRRQGGCRCGRPAGAAGEHRLPPRRRAPCCRYPASGPTASPPPRARTPRRAPSACRRPSPPHRDRSGGARLRRASTASADVHRRCHRDGWFLPYCRARVRSRALLLLVAASWWSVAPHDDDPARGGATAEVAGLDEPAAARGSRSSCSPVVLLLLVRSAAAPADPATPPHPAPDRRTERDAPRSFSSSRRRRVRAVGRVLAPAGDAGRRRGRDAARPCS